MKRKHEGSVSIEEPSQKKQVNASAASSIQIKYEDVLIELIRKYNAQGVGIFARYTDTHLKKDLKRILNCIKVECPFSEWNIDSRERVFKQAIIGWKVTESFFSASLSGRLTKGYMINALTTIDKCPFVHWLLNNHPRELLRCKETYKHHWSIVELILDSIAKEKCKYDEHYIRFKWNHSLPSTIFYDVEKSKDRTIFDNAPISCIIKVIQCGCDTELCHIPPKHHNNSQVFNEVINQISYDVYLRRDFPQIFKEDSRIAEHLVKTGQAEYKIVDGFARKINIPKDIISNIDVMYRLLKSHPKSIECFRFAMPHEEMKDIEFFFKLKFHWRSRGMHSMYSKKPNAQYHLRDLYFGHSPWHEENKELEFPSHIRIADVGNSTNFTFQTIITFKFK